MPNAGFSGEEENQVARGNNSSSKKVFDERIRATDAMREFNISGMTMARWIREEIITTAEDPADRRVKLIRRGEVKNLVEQSAHLKKRASVIG